MKTKLQDFFFQKRVIFILFFLTSLLLAFGSYKYYEFSTESLRGEKANELKAIANLKINQLVNWRKERVADVIVISKSPFFSAAVDEWIINKTNLGLKKEIENRLLMPQSEYGFKSIYLTSLDGEIFLSVGEGIKKKKQKTEDLIVEVSKNPSITSSDFFRSDLDSNIYYDIVAPVFNKRNDVIAALVFRIDPYDFLYPLINEWPIPSKSAETVLLKIDGDSIVYLNELRHRQNTALNLRIPLTRTELAAVRAALGETGIFNGIDYRGVEVLSYLSPVPNTNWFMISKVDKSEIFEEIRYRGTFLILFSVAVIVGLSMGLGFIYSRRQKIIYQQLWTTESKFNITIDSIGDAVITTDTDGIIQYMNPMAENLTGWKLEDAKNKRL